MAEQKKYTLTISTVPDLETGRQIARALVESHLAACVNIVPGLHSIYEWQGKIEESEESLLIIKSTEQVLKPLTEKILELHPYDCPEVLSFDIRTGNPAYLDWIDSVTGKSAPTEEDP